MTKISIVINGIFSAYELNSNGIIRVGSHFKMGLTVTTGPSLNVKMDGD